MSDAMMATAEKSEHVYRVLFLCTGNSARSILAEALLEHHGAPRYRGSSAGSLPKRAPHPIALEALADRGFPVDGLRSKSWDEFARPGAPVVDLVITVCDAAAQAANESCPVWPGGPVTAHWGLADPAAFEGSPAEVRERFELTFAELEDRIGRLLLLDPSGLGLEQFACSVAEIGLLESGSKF